MSQVHCVFIAPLHPMGDGVFGRETDRTHLPSPSASAASLEAAGRRLGLRIEAGGAWARHIGLSVRSSCVSGWEEIAMLSLGWENRELSDISPPLPLLDADTA